MGFDFGPHPGGELVRTVAQRLDGNEGQRAPFHHAAHRYVDPFAARQQGLHTLFEGVDHGAFAAAGRFLHVLQTQGRLAHAAGTAEDGHRAAFQAAVQELVEFGHAGRHLAVLERALVRSRDQVREDLHAVAVETQGVPTRAEVGTAELGDAYGALFPAIAQLEDAVGHEAQIAVRGLRGRLRGKEQGHPLFGEKAQEGQHLLAELEGVAGEQAELGHAVQKDAPGLLLLNLFDDSLRERFALHLGRGEQVVGLHLGEELGGGAQIQEGDVGQIETEFLAVLADALPGLFEGDEQGFFTGGHSGGQEVEPQDGLAGARSAAGQIRASGDQTAVQDLVQTGDAGRQAGFGFFSHGRFAPRRSAAGQVAWNDWYLNTGPCDLCQAGARGSTRL